MTAVMRGAILDLVGPILVIGASGFVGANLFRTILGKRNDVVGTVYSGDSWRLRGISSENIAFLDIENPVGLSSLLLRVAPKTIFDCSSFGAYSFEHDQKRIHQINYLSFIDLMEQVSKMELAAFIHAGSSSEYGLNAAGPLEDSLLVPNSHYAVSKAAASNAVSFYGKVRRLPVVNLRLYSVYGPYEDSSRLIPVLCEKGMQGQLPPFASPSVTRDFIHVDDVVAAFVQAALKMNPQLYGQSFNIGTGIQTSLASLAGMARQIFSIAEDASFNSSVARSWDLDNWFANPSKAKVLLEWRSEIHLEAGFHATCDWWREHLKSSNFSSLTKKKKINPIEKKSISAIVACYKDAQAIPIMHARLVAIFTRLDLDYEILFINDCSPDNSAEVIREISARDHHVIGVTHTRNFGSQAAFRSGMELARKEACVLLDGDLQDPPELIEGFVSKWRAGADVVYGRRIKREMPIFMEIFYRGFYRIFSAMSEVKVPRDAGDFSLLDQSVVHWMLQCKERDAFLRGLRAYVGFNQIGVDYVRPERMFGTSTNNWIKNIGWAKKGIFSFSRMPLHLLTAFGGVACVGTIVLSAISIIVRLLEPEMVPKGITFLSLLVMFFGSAMMLGIGLLGEYIGKIFEETKARPAFIRHHLIVQGEIRQVQYNKVSQENN